MTQGTDPDPPRDPRLLAALRHAPDRDDRPPAALREAILSQARRAAKEAAPKRPAPWLARAWAALQQPRLAGALGMLVVAGVIGLLWREGPPPEAVPGADAPTVAEPAAASPPEPATRSVPVAPQPAAIPAPARSTRDATGEARAPAAKQAPAPEAAPAAAPVPAMRLPAPGFDPLAPALAALSGAADARWRERLLQLRSRVQGRWTSAPDDHADAGLPTPGEAVSTAAGQPLGRLLLGDDQVLWRDADGRLWRATLAAASAAPAASR